MLTIKCLKYYSIHYKKHAHPVANRGLAGNFTKKKTINKLTNLFCGFMSYKLYFPKRSSPYNFEITKVISPHTQKLHLLYGVPV